MSAFIDSLSAGVYYISVLDANNCVSDTVVQISQPQNLMLLIQIQSLLVMDIRMAC